jgi:hypothetical protein
MADGNFMTNQKVPGKKNDYKHADRNDKIVFPLGRFPDRGSFFTSLHYFTNKTKPLKVYSKYWPIKVDLFWQYEASISLYIWFLPIMNV